MRTLALTAAAVAAALLATPALARADSTQGQAHLVYYFTYGSDQEVTSRDQQGNMDIASTTGALSGANANSTSGISDYHGRLDDKGTMTVDVVGLQPDKGLVVNISEAGQNTRRAPPATCVVYGNTRVICDPNKTVYPEEYTLLRFLGANFIPTPLDQNKSWAIEQNGSNVDVKANYVVTSAGNGVAQISETRSIRTDNGGSLTTDVQTKIGYDLTHGLPNSVEEYVLQHKDNGVSGTTTTIYQTTLKLMSNSTTSQTSSPMEFSQTTR
jgi:hypothetical protein